MDGGLLAKNLLKKSAREPAKSLAIGIVSSLIATGIAAIRPAREVAWAVLKWIGRLLESGWDHLGSTVPVPLWVVYVVVGLLVWAAISVARRIQITKDTGQAAPDLDPNPNPNPLTFRQAHINGVVWRWNWGRGFQPINLAAFCPRCDLQVPLNWPEPGLGLNAPIVCDRCTYQLDLDFYSTAQVQSFARREIQRQVRTGEWRKSVSSVDQST